MKTLPLFLVSSAAAALLGTQAVASVDNYSIGLNFGADEYPNSPNAGTLQPADVAGVPDVKQANWNNLTGVLNADGVVLNADNKGVKVATQCKVTWSGSPNLWSTSGRGEENNGFTPNTPDWRLMLGYLDTSAATTTLITITGIPTELTSGDGYDVYVYCLGGVGNRGGSSRVLDADLPDPTSAPLTDDKLITSASGSPGTFILDKTVDPQNRPRPGNYIIFRSLKKPNIIVDASTERFPYGGTPRAPVDAVQLVKSTGMSPDWVDPVGYGWGFVMSVDDNAKVTVDPAAPVAVKLDDQTISPTVVKDASGTTTITYDYFKATGQWWPPNDKHTVAVTIKGTDGKNYSRTAQFAVGVYGALEESWALPDGAVDKAKKGFLVRTWQTDMTGLPNSNTRSEAQLAGEYGANVADLTPFTDNGYYDETAVINYGASAGGTTGDFPDDLQLPGIPGNPSVANPTEQYSMEFFTFLEFPKAGFFQMGVNSDDGFRTRAGLDLQDRWSLDAVQFGEFNGGRGAGDSIFTFLVKKPGIYPFRTTFEQGGGGHSVEWFTLVGTNKVLINDPASTDSVKAYRGTYAARPYVKTARAKSNPDTFMNIDVEPNAVVEVVIVDGKASKVKSGTVKMTINGATVTPSVNSAGGTTTVSYNPPSPWARPSRQDVTVSYDEDPAPSATSTGRSVSFWFKVRGYLPSELAANSFWIEMEDFDNNGQTQAAASTMPYLGGAYADLTAKIGIDYQNDDNPGDSASGGQGIYRNGGDLEKTNPNQGVNIADNLGGRWGSERPGGVTMTANYKIGWINSGDWMDYTRTIPAGVYEVYSAQSYDGHDNGQLAGRVGIVTAGAGTSTQTTKRYGSFSGPGTAGLEGFGGWSRNSLVPMQAFGGAKGYAKLPGGKVTIRFWADSGDADWFAFSPAAGTVSPLLISAPTASISVRRDAVLTWELADMSTKVVTSSVKLSVDGTDVSSKLTATKTAEGATVTYGGPANLLDAGAHAFELSVTDDGATPKTQKWSGAFKANPYPTPGIFVIEAEDFDYDKGQTVAAASTMPYLGGAYSNLNAVIKIDYDSNDGTDSNPYRTNFFVAGLNRDMNENLGGRLAKDRGAYEVKANFKLGWADTGDWGNYTRTFPANSYQVWAALSHGDALGLPDRLRGKLDLVQSGVGTTNQTLQALGLFNAVSTGGWGDNELVPMTDKPGGAVQTVALSGKQTVRFTTDSGDFDYLVFVPGGGPPPISVAISRSGANVTLTWTDAAATLQSADKVNGPYADLAGASPKTVAATGPAKFYRLKK